MLLKQAEEQVNNLYVIYNILFDTFLEGLQVHAGGDHKLIICVILYARQMDGLREAINYKCRK